MRALSALLACLVAAGCAAAGAPVRLGFDGSEMVMPAQAHAGATPIAKVPVQGAGVAPTNDLTELCAPEIGFAQGAAGATDAGLCAADQAAAYAAAYSSGAALFAARVEAAQIRAEISATQRELWSVKRLASMPATALTALSGRTDVRREAKSEKAALLQEDLRLSEVLERLQRALIAAESDIREREAVGWTVAAASVTAEASAPIAAIPAAY